MSAILEAALAALESGFSVIPTDVATKKPAGEPPIRWEPYQDHLPAPAQLKTWWQRYPSAGLAIITGSTSRVVVVDVDDPRPEALEAALAAFGQTQRIARTPRGGWHLYYRYPTDSVVGNAVGIPGFDFKIDLRGEGGYALCPPSPGYSWERRGAWAALPVFPGVPQAKRSNGSANGRDWNALATGVPEGHRHDTLKALLARARAKGLEPEEIAALGEGFAARCAPPIPADEVRGLIEWASALPDAKGNLPRDDRDEEHQNGGPDPVEDRDQRLDLPQAARRGSFAGFLEYLAPVTGAAPAHVFAAWLAALAVCIGPRRWGSWSGRVVPVFYITLAGWTGDHKSSAADRSMELLPDTVLRVDGATSDAGLFDALEAGNGKPAVLHFDELGFLLKMAALSGSTLDPMLNRLWGAPRYLDRNLSKRTANGGARRIERPFACMIACTQPETFWGSLGDDRLAIASGFVNRLAVFAVERGASRSLPRTQPPNESIAENLRAHLELMTTLDPAEVKLDASAERVWDDFSREHDERIAQMDMIRASVAKRIRDHVARLALVFAADAERATVSIEDLDGAIDVGGYLEQSYQRLLLGRQAERGPARASSLEAIVRGLLAKRPKTWHSARDLIRSWPNASRPGSEELRRVLKAMDGVEIQPGSGSRRERFRLPHDTTPDR